MIGRRVVTIGVVTAAVAVGGVAGALIGIPGLSGASSAAKPAQTSSAPSSGHHRGGPGGFGGFGAFAGGADKGELDAAAAALKLSTPALLAKLSDGKTTIADVATQQSVALSTVIAAMEKVADNDISNLVNNPFPMRPTFKGHGPFGGSGGSGAIGGTGPSGPLPSFAPGIGFGFGIGMRGALGGSVDSLAKALHLSTPDLIKDLANGQSIAAIAKTKGVDVNTLITTLVNDATATINSAVKAGHLSSAQASKLEANLPAEITKLVNGSLPTGFGHFGGRGGGRGDYGPNHGAANAAPAPAPEGATSN
jgi:hypothetical protein